MRNLSSRLSAATAAALLLLAALSFGNAPSLMRAGAQQQPPRAAIHTYAITNARIVPVVGSIIERGTVVVRDGLIAAVGANTTAPADARIIDATGLTVYPGLIDAHTTLGIPAPTPTPTPAPGTGGPFAAFLTRTAAPSATSPNSTQPPGLQPEILASDIIRPGGEQIEAARNAGLTAALTAPRGLIFVGQSAFINLAGDTPQQMNVRSPVALHMGFTPLGSGTYPASTLGVFSAIRQLLLDARRYREANAAYEKNPRGQRRPEQDKSLAALQPALSREMPVVMLADREREIIRALDLAQEFNLRAIIAGGTESWKVAERLRAANVPVLLSLNFPRRTTAQVADADPEPMRTLRDRADAPKVAARLAQAGILFAFQSGAMSNMADYLSNATRAVEHGLARDEALRAMTLRPAELFGVADRLGSIEVGKIANLTITRGDLFDKNRRITHVFIDGRPVDLKPSTTAAAPAGALNLSGTWNLRVNTGGAGDPEVAITLLLQQQGERLTGSIQGALGSNPIANATLGASGELRFSVPVTLEGQTTEINFAGTVTGNEMRGTVEAVGRGTGSFTGTRSGESPTTPRPASPTTTSPPAATTATPPSGTTDTPEGRRR